MRTTNPGCPSCTLSAGFCVREAATGRLHFPAHHDDAAQAKAPRLAAEVRCMPDLGQGEEEMIHS
jgi:hypothetical protein